MYLVCSTLPFREKTLPEALRKIARLGVKRVEFCADPLHSFPEQWEESPEEILQLVDRLGIKVNSIHVPLTEMPQNISYEELRRISTKQTKMTIDLAAFSNNFILSREVENENIKTIGLTLPPMMVMEVMLDYKN